MSDTRDCFKLRIPIFFDAAHKLSDSKDLFTKKCASLHGHTYHAVIGVSSKDNSKHGMVIDFKALKDAINNKLDHKYINEVFSEQYGENAKEPTAENIALYIKEVVAHTLNAKKVAVKNITVRLAEGYKGPCNTTYVLI